MSGSTGVVKGHSPVGYVTPLFPSLSFDLTENPYTAPLLFYSWDIYVFTVYWHLIFSTGFHVAAVLLAYASNIRMAGKRIRRLLTMLLVFSVMGAFYGFALGSFIGLILGSVYRAGALHMSTWVPFTWGLGVMVFAVVVSYERTAITI